MGKTETNAPAKTEAAKPEKKADTPKRKMLTPAERVAKLEAELREAREKAEAKDKKKAQDLRDKRATLVAKKADIEKQIAAIDEDLAKLVPATEKTDAA